MGKIHQQRQFHIYIATNLPCTIASIGTKNSLKLEKLLGLINDEYWQNKNILLFRMFQRTFFNQINMFNFGEP